MSSRRTDLALAGGGAGVAAVSAALWGSGYTAAVLGVLLGLALGTSRRFPRATWAFVAVLLVFWGTSGVTTEADDFVVFPLMAAHTFCAGRWDGHLHGLGGLVAIAVAGVIVAIAVGTEIVPLLMIPIAGWAPGRALRQRELVAEQLAARVRDLEEEREAYAALSVRYERARIASELHDIVAHALSVMVVQASAGQRLMAADPESASETFEVIAAAAREAEDDMQRLVALLSDEDGIGPAPDLPLVEELVARAAGSGLDVTLRLEGEREGFPPTVGALAYRIVQEGITNALRYASGAVVRVVVRGDSESLSVLVANGPAPRTTAALADVGTGNGLRGLRERVGAAGGSLDAGPTADHGWRLAAVLPRHPVTSAV